MRTSLLALSLVAVTGLPGVAFAQTAPPAAALSDHTITGNVGLFSEYRFRGISQTFGKPALQGGFDYSHSSGTYLGNWNSNVSSGAGSPAGNLEMDFYMKADRACPDTSVPSRSRVTASAPMGAMPITPTGRSV